MVLFCAGTDFVECVKIHKAGKCENFGRGDRKWFADICEGHRYRHSERRSAENFEKGFTGYNGRMDKKASGLGLYLCKGVCEKLGHEIRVVSEEGEGTTVILTLQLEKVQQRDLVNM